MIRSFSPIPVLRSLCLITGVLVVTTMPLRAAAWGWEGHKLVCGLAQTQLTPDAAKMVEQLLNDGAGLSGGRVNFAESCLWPDKVKHSSHRGTYEHHFINVPDNAMTVDLARDCGDMNCIATGVQQALSYLHQGVSGKRETLRRASALRFLGHHVADLHQPLHVGNASDWGGNKIRVAWKKKDSNLHALWDYEMLDAVNFTYPDSVTMLRPGSTEEMSDEPDMVEWLDESLALARSHAYRDTDGDMIHSGARLGQAYLERSKPIMLERLSLAAARLAVLLNAIAAGEQPVLVEPIAR